MAWVAARLERVSASLCTPQAASAENTTATAAVFARRWHCTDQVMPVSSIRAGAFRVRIVLLIVSVYHIQIVVSPILPGVALRCKTVWRIMSP